MSDEELIALAETHFYIGKPVQVVEGDASDLIWFAREVERLTLERAAKVCEGARAPIGPNADHNAFAAGLCDGLARAIRALASPTVSKPRLAMRSETPAGTDSR